MAEPISSKYKRLFEVRLLHHYWLDNGPILFDTLDEETKTRRLLTYDVRTFLAITPTKSTQTTLKKLGGVYRQTALGCVVVVPEGKVIPASTQFDLVVTIQNPAFSQYTAMTLTQPSIQEYYHRADNIYYRYRTNVPVLSNLTGVSRTINGTKALFLSKEIPTLAASATARVESLVRSGAALIQLTSDQPGATTQSLNAQATTQPVYVHQGDIPLIGAVPALDGFPVAGLSGIRLTPEVPDNVYATVRIVAERPDNTDFSCVVNELPKAAAPVFQVRFKNRSTVWQYIDKRTGAVLSTEPASLPLTYFSAENNTKLKPLPDSVYLSFDPNNPKKITRLFSRILK